MAVHLTRSDCEGFFKKCCISNVAEGTDIDMLWNGSEDGNVGCVRKIKALTLKMETVILIDKGR
jgi:hypothetical protein